LSGMKAGGKWVESNGRLVHCKRQCNEKTSYPFQKIFCECCEHYQNSHYHSLPRTMFQSYGKKLVCWYCNLPGKTVCYCYDLSGHQHCKRVYCDYKCSLNLSCRKVCCYCSLSEIQSCKKVCCYCSLSGN